MPNLSVRQLDENTVAALRLQAAEHGVSMEEEARRILKQAVRSQQPLGDLALQLFQPVWANSDNINSDEFSIPDREIEPPINFD